MISERIHQARLAAGLTLAALGATLDLSHTAIQKFEKGTLTPSSSQLLKIARACGVRTEYFFRAQQIELLNTEFRKLASFGKNAQEALKIKVAGLIEKRVELLNAFPENPLPVFAAMVAHANQLKSLNEVEEFSATVRDAWTLGMDPIADLTGTLEALGLLVVMVDEENSKFSGFTAIARTSDGRDYPVIAVAAQWPGDRQRFTLAHELAHLLLNGRLRADVNEEKACDRFAVAFLAPRIAVLRALGATRRTLEWQELYVLKHEFGLSIAGWLQRAKQCGVISEATHLSLFKWLSAQGWRKTEPGDSVPKEQPRLFEQLIYRALAERYISEGKAAELLGIPMMTFHKERRLESTGANAHQ